MAKNKISKRPLVSFFGLSYLIFLVLFSITGLGIVLGFPETVTNILQIVAAWSSTFAFLIIFKRVFPEIEFWNFVKKQFQEKIKASTIITVVLLQLIIFGLVIVLPGTGLKISLSFSGLGILLFHFINNLIRGSLGEELGWRGFAQKELQKKHSPLVSSLIIGALWGFWHAPLWLVSGYKGIDLIQYIIVFLLGIISISIIISLFYNLSGNLIIPIIIHQLFNFLVVITSGELLITLTYTCLSYFVLAVILIAVNPRELLYEGSSGNKSVEV